MSELCTVVIARPTAAHDRVMNPSGNRRRHVRQVPGQAVGRPEEKRPNLGAVEERIQANLVIKRG